MTTKLQLINIIIIIIIKFLTTLTSLSILQLLGYVKKHNGKLTQNLSIHDYDMRRRCDIHVQIHNTLLFKKTVISMGIELYNKLPYRIKKCKDL